MADEADLANDQSQMILDNQIKMKRKDIDPFQNISGVCWGCNAPVEDGRRWCSIECRDAIDE
jgi:hypothetical protein